MNMINWAKEWPKKHEYIVDFFVKVVAVVCKWSLKLALGAVVVTLPFICVMLLALLFGIEVGP